MTKRRQRIVAALSAFLALIIPAVAVGGTLEFPFDAGDFSAPTTITNDYWSLRIASPGPAAYFAESEDGCEVTESTVVGTTGLGFFDDPYDIDAVVIQDREWVSEDCDGVYVLVEDTFDWFAQDDAGNVWYLGEDTTSWDDDENCLSTGGAWQSGEDGAEPGVIMTAQPRRGASYRQEFYEGEAEDMAKVLRLDAPVSIEFGEYAGCLKTKEFTPLEPGHIEHKYYCRVSEGGPGLALVNELKGRTMRVEYVGATRPPGTYPMTFPTSEGCAD
jgi:hypothetical protein